MKRYQILVTLRDGVRDNELLANTVIEKYEVTEL